MIGVGEPPTISTAAAIGNAVTNAIGVRVPEWPMTPRNVLERPGHGFQRREGVITHESF